MATPIGHPLVCYRSATDVDCCRLVGRQLFSELVPVALLFTFAFSRLNANFFVVLLKGCKVLTCFAELSFFHTLSNIMVHKGTFGVHQVKLVVNAAEHLCNGCAVRDHAASTHHLSEVATRHHSRWLVIDAALEAGGAPIHKLNGAFC